MTAIIRDNNMIEFEHREKYSNQIIEQVLFK
jgi:hypothetical protein